VRQPENIARYRGQVVVLHNRVVLGSGAGHVEAMADARRRAEAENRSLLEQELFLFPVPDPGWFPPEYFGGTPIRGQQG
jgi:hypothetical protein